MLTGKEKAIIRFISDPELMFFNKYSDLSAHYEQNL